MVRIVAGSAKGRVLKVPSSGTRPTSEKVREALFSRLEHRGFVVGCAVVDLYAGSGAFGLEAASRGAGHVECIEKAPAAARVIVENAKSCGLDVTVRRERARSWVSRPAARAYDLAFLDPPYATGEDELAEVLEGLEAHLAEDGAVLVERDRRSPEPRWPARMECSEERTWGDTRIWFARMAEMPEERGEPIGA